MKKLFIMFILLGLLAGIVGCNRLGGGSDLDPEPEPDPDTQEEIGITFWNNLTGADGVVMRQLVAQFNQEFKDKIIVSETYVNELTHYSNIDNLVPLGRGPDVALMHSHRVPSYVDKEVIVPVESYISESDIDFSDYVQDVMTSLTIDNKTYGIPLDLHTVGIYYNTALLDKYSLAVPTNRTELIQAAKTVQQGENRNNFYGFPISNAWPSEWTFTTSLFQNGGHEVVGLETPGYNNAVGVKAMKQVADLIHVHKLSPNTLSVDQDLFAFENGDALFHIQGSWMLNAIKQSRVGNSFNVLPLSTMFADEDIDSKNQVYARSHVFVLPMPKRDPSQARKNAISTFIKWMGDHSYTWAEAGQIPASNIARQSDEYLAIPFIHNFGDPTNFRVPAQTPYYQEAYGVVWAYVTQVLSIAPGAVNSNYTDSEILKLFNAAADEAKQLIAAAKE